jgi:hypothetical protein
LVDLAEQRLAIGEGFADPGGGQDHVGPVVLELLVEPGNALLSPPLGLVEGSTVPFLLFEIGDLLPALLESLGVIADVSLGGLKVRCGLVVSAADAGPDPADPAGSVAPRLPKRDTLLALCQVTLSRRRCRSSRSARR